MKLLWHHWLIILISAVIAFGAGTISFDTLSPSIVCGICTSVLCYLSITDIRVNLVPNKVVLPALIPSILVFHFGPFGTETGVLPSIVISMSGGAFAMLIAFLPNLGSRKRLGSGDIKMLGLAGTMAGIGHLPWVLISGASLTGLIAIALLATRKAKLNDTIPMTPFFSGPTIAILVLAPYIPTFYDFIVKIYS